ncbi:DNA-protecting protein DprA [Alcaligenes faecalis]|uniref:DNA-processing protein DprA n=1 Tax=Alcaligenes faecalis TaxID=511 RepID=UPI00122D27D2|nr:DNA-processing protein DprA [Alcaligenes faecalis]KAA1288962.1 DNA-processing protein DprA [Alcaligenes faecalis]MCM2558773.1 DNA-protecting protein DprA [Alcaligenes faecalis]MCM2622635.1 DNA-protecting protein DprA [Alcaligenes faecalis]MCR4142882.1 DNA-protecting protein DprA [Alcaligenes faecalis]WHQ43808.1 DNA-processing protein DprA [Alcaligenes faecalis]
MSVVSPATLTLLTLSMLKGVGPAALKKVAALSGFEDMPIEALATSVPAIEKALLEPDAWILAQEAAVKQVDEAQRHEARILSAVDGEYPPLLAATKDDPFILFVKGTLAQPSERSVAVIGTREPTMHGQRIAMSITNFFVEQRWSIVSGLATGCDAVAHQAALDAGGHTAAVLAHGLQMIAPAKHKKLAEHILAAGGVLISEYPFGQTVRSQQYVKRDRTQAGLAQGVVMIQSDIKGGSLYASRASLDYGRWLAVPYPTDKDRERGEPKIQANLVIAEAGDGQRTDLLRCSPSKLKKIIVLHSREDYFQLLGSVCESTQVGNSLPISSAPGNQKSIKANAGEASEVEQPRSVQDSEAPAPISKGPTSVKEPTSRRVVLDKSRLSDLNIQQMPSEDSQDFKKLAVQLRDVDLLTALSARLRYLQMQLEILASLSADSRAIVDKECRLTIQFVVEAMLVHMKRAIVSLTQLAGDEHTVQHDLFAMVNKGRQDVPQQFELGYAPIPEHEPDFLLGMLDEFLGTLLQPLKFAEDGGTYPVSGDADLCFDDLVTAFNTLIARGLHV